MKCGTSKAEITNRSVPVHDPIFAKTLVFQDDNLTVAVLSMDCVSLGGGIGGLSDDFFPLVKEYARSLGIDAVICGTTHTHTPGQMLCAESIILSRIQASLREALGTLEPCVLKTGITHENSYLLNRTLLLKDGTAWTVRQAHPCPPDEEIASLQDADDTVHILKFSNPDGQALCTCFTYGCHPLLGYADNSITANYPGVAERLIEDTVGGMAMMLESCGGDATEVNYKDFEHPKCCENVGLQLGSTVLKALRTLTPCDGTIQYALQTMTFPRRTDIPAVRAKLLAEQESLLCGLSDCPLNFKAFLPLYIRYLNAPDYPLDYKFAYLREEKLGKTQLLSQDSINRKNIEKYLSNLRAMEKLSKIRSTLETLAWHEEYNRASGSDTIDGEAVALKIGDFLLVTAPVEMLNGVGRKVKAIAGENVCIVSYANGYMHYGATAEEYNNGGYETIECFLDSGWEAIYLEAVKKLLQKLQ